MTEYIGIYRFVKMISNNCDKGLCGEDCPHNEECSTKIWEDLREDLRKLDFTSEEVKCMTTEE